jgi:very-short-patch-repair endonuclease/predicted transcriptional regulator of viral defense system
VANRDAFAALMTLAGRQAGAVAVSDALALGVTRRAIRHALEQRVLERWGQGLLLVAGAPRGWWQEAWLNHLAAGADSAIGGRAAARAHGLRRYARADVEVLVPRLTSHLAQLGRIRESRDLPPHHIVLMDGLPVTSLARTIFDLAGDPEHRLTFRKEALREAHKRKIKRLIDEAMRHHGMAMGALVMTLDTLGKRGRAGTRIIRELIDELGADYKPTDSQLEDMFLELVRSHGLEEPVRQRNIGGERGWVGRVDFLYADKKLVIEVDGPGHDTPVQQQLDAVRDAELRLRGYDILRVHWTELLRDRGRVVARLEQALAATAEPAPAPVLPSVLDPR